MDVRIQITDEGEIKRRVEQQITSQLEAVIKQKLTEIDLDKLILDRVNYLIDRSKYVSDDIIRNLVQQRIAKELTGKIINL